MKRFRFAIDWRLLGFSACIVFIATASAAQFECGTFRLYCDSLFTCTATTDTVPRILKVYVVHDAFGDGTWSTGSIFMVSGGGGFTGVWIGDTTPYPVVVGTSPTGIAIGYSACVRSGHLLTITYVTSGTSAPDSYLEVLPHPDVPSRRIEVALCVGMSCFCNGSRLTINPSGVPAESTTWGRIKGMYE